MLSRASTYLNSVQFSRVLPSSPPPAGGIITDGLFMELDASLYGGIGNWIDNTGNGNNAVINGPIFDNTSEIPYFLFSGKSPTMTINHEPEFSVLTTQQRTIQLWVKLASVPSVPNRMVLFGKMSSNFNFDGWWGGVSSTAAAAGNPLVIATKETTSYSLTLPVQLNTWYLFTYITQITGTSNTTKVYLNSTSHISTNHPASPPQPNDVFEAESNNLTIGYLTPPLTGLGQIVHLNGYVGAIYFYTRGLSQAEISTNFEATRGRFGV